MADKKISQLTGATTPLAGTEVLPIVQGGNTVKVAVSDLTAGRAVSASSLSSTTKVSAKIATSGTFYRVYEILATGGSAIGEISYSDTNDTMRIANLSNFANTSMTFYNNGSDRLEILPNGNIKAIAQDFVVGTAGRGIDFSANTGAPGETSALLNWYEEGTWTPSVASSSGTITTVGTCTGQYTRIGRQVTLSMDIRITTNGSGAGFLSVTGIPFTMGNTLYGAGCGSEIGVTGKMIQMSAGNTTTINLTNYDSTYPAADGFRATLVWTYFV
jgi:hypothetical protein